MPIRFIPNDPRAGQPASIVVVPHADRPDHLAGFRYQGVFHEADLPLASEGFLYWQCREAALRAIDLWEVISGTELESWQSGRTLFLKHRTPGRPQLNAFYDRRSLSFYEVMGPNGDVYRSGASTDVVAHEAGHAFLDSIRPDLWGSFFGEPGAFHEAFGDCIAILTALLDPASRQTLVDGDLLRHANFVEATSEDLAHGIGQVYGADHNASVPRIALNSHQWVMPASLPIDGAPGELINEVHTLGMIFSGCFYDTLTNIYDAGNLPGEEGLRQAAVTAGKLLVEGARTAPVKSRFFQSVGNAMLLADDAQSGGINGDAIRAGFAAHNVILNAAEMTAPSVLLAGRPPVESARSVRDVLTPASRRGLIDILGEAPEQRLFAAEFRLGAAQVAAVRRRQKVPLGDVAEELEGVFCLAEEDVLIGEQNGTAAMLGEVETVRQSAAEVQNFVYSLHKAGQIALEGETDEAEQAAGGVSHAVSVAGGERRLVRKRFACGCCGVQKPVSLCCA